MQLLLILFIATPASAQTFETVGIRALGMGGAFVAVADDASATWWNPAGLGTGAYVNAILERTRAETVPGRDTPTAGLTGASRDTVTDFSVAFPALGISYYRVQQTAVGPAGAAADGSSVPGAVASLRTSQLGFTFLQSLLPGVVVGSTLKYVRGTVASLPGTLGDSATQALDRGDAADGQTTGAFDLDLGAMGAFGPLHLGITARNVRQPEFDMPGGGTPVALKRQIRIGAAVAPQLSGRGLIDAFTVAVDDDLTRSITVLGERRHLAAGAEAWLLNRHVGVRGGIRINTLGERLPIATAGLSVALHSGVYVEGEISRGRDAVAQGWGLGARLTF
jgi:hypothetical protein